MHGFGFRPKSMHYIRHKQKTSVTAAEPVNCGGRCG